MHYSRQKIPEPPKSPKPRAPLHTPRSPDPMTPEQRSPARRPPPPPRHHHRRRRDATAGAARASPEPPPADPHPRGALTAPHARPPHLVLTPPQTRLLHSHMLSLLGLLASTSAQPRPQKDQELRQSTEQADPVVTFGPSEPSAALIWMHGLGDTPDGWAQLLRVYEVAKPSCRTRNSSCPRRRCDR